MKGKPKFSDITDSMARIQQNFLGMHRYDSDMSKTNKKRWLEIKTNFADYTYFAGSLNIFALLFIIPFKVELDSSSDLFRIRTTKLRTVLCGMIHAAGVTLLFTCGYLKCFIYGLKPKRFEYIIYALDFGMTTVFALTVIKVLWTDQCLIEAFLNTRSYRGSVVSRIKVWLAALSCLLLFICDLQTRTVADISSCNFVLPSSWAQNSLFIEIMQQAVNYVLTSIIFLSQLFIYIGEALCGTLAITMWRICKNLKGKLLWDTPFQQGLEIYNEHRAVVETVNQFSSGLFFTNLMSSLVYYAQAPMVYYFGQETHDYEKVIMMSYILITLMIWGFAGECHAQLSKFLEGFFWHYALFLQTRRTIKKWVIQQQEKADESTLPCEQFKLAAISHNLDSDPIALSCSFFNITYGFEVSMLGLLISYNIIIFQMEEQGSSTKLTDGVIT